LIDYIVWVSKIVFVIIQTDQLKGSLNSD